MTARLPMHPVPNRGSSPANAITSIARDSPRSRSAATASIAPSTPTTPSKRPAFRVVSTWDPVRTTGSDGSRPSRRP